MAGKLIQIYFHPKELILFKLPWEEIENPCKSQEEWSCKNVAFRSVSARCQALSFPWYQDLVMWLLKCL